MKKKEALLLTSNIATGAALLSVLIAAAIVNDKKKIQYLIYSAICLSIALTALAIFALTRKIEHEKIKHSDSNLNLNEEVAEKEEEKQPLLSSSVSCPEGLTDKTVPVEEVKDEVEKIKNTEENINKIGNYHSLTGQPVSTTSFGQDESIIAVTLPEDYSIKKYESGKEIQSAKNGIIDDKYKPVDFSINKIEKVNEKGKKKDSYQFIFKFQSMQNANVFIEVSCDTLNVYSGWKKNEEKSVAQYFKALKANDDFLIFLDVKEIFSGFLGKVLTFAQKIFPANDQGLSSVAGKDAHKHFKLKLLQEKSSHYIYAKGKGILSLLDKKFPINDILVNDKLIHKKQEAEHKHEDDISETTKIAKSVVQSEVTDDEEARNPSQFQNEENETDASNLNSVPPSPSTSSGIVSEEASSVDDIKTEELKEEYMEREEEQPVEKSSNASSSKSTSDSQRSVGNTSEPNKDFIGKVNSFWGKIKNKSTKDDNEKRSEKSLKGNEKKKFSFLKKSKDRSTKSEGASPSPSIASSSLANTGGQDNLGFAKD